MQPLRHSIGFPRLGRGALAALFLVTLEIAARPAVAQSTAGKADREVARTFELRARDGMDRQLDDGYRRHLEWHVAAGDRWGWYLWEVTNGERAGLYVDGTFGHAWADFDAAVNPPGDAADNAVNVEPFAARAANHVWWRRPELGGAPVDLEAAPLVLRTEYRVWAGADSAFTATLQRLRASAGTRPYAVHERVSGGELPTYIVWVPLASWAEAGAFVSQTDGIARALAASAQRVQAELWRFRPDLSLCRRPLPGVTARSRHCRREPGCRPLPSASHTAQRPPSRAGARMQHNQRGADAGQPPSMALAARGRG